MKLTLIFTNVETNRVVGRYEAATITDVHHLLRQYTDAADRVAYTFDEEMHELTPHRTNEPDHRVAIHIVNAALEYSQYLPVKAMVCKIELIAPEGNITLHLNSYMPSAEFFVDVEFDITQLILFAMYQSVQSIQQRTSHTYLLNQLQLHTVEGNELVSTIKLLARDQGDIANDIRSVMETLNVLTSRIELAN